MTTSLLNPRMRILSRTLFILSSIFCSSDLVASPFWDANQIAAASSEYLQLKDQNGKIYSTIKPSVVRIIFAAKNKVEMAAGDIRVHLWIDGEEKANAFATYNNNEPTIGINVGMLQALGEDEEAYAALIGHELAHLYLNHPAKYAQRNSAKTVTSWILGFALGYAGVPGGGSIADMTTTAISTVYSRDDERDADVEGMKYMLKAGYDPYGAVHMQEKLAAASSGDLLPFLSSHPSGSERIKNMKQLAEIAKSNQVSNPVAGEHPDSANEPQNSIASGEPAAIHSESLSLNEQPNSNENIAQKLRELKQLYLDGIIDHSDYTKKRKQLIEKL